MQYGVLRNWTLGPLPPNLRDRLVASLGLQTRGRVSTHGLTSPKEDKLAKAKRKKDFLLSPVLLCTSSLLQVPQGL
jgi:hypothetical protein